MYTYLCSFRCCAGGKDDDDFKPLFEGFVQDLLVTLHLPEWPAAELLLMLLGGLLVCYGTALHPTTCTKYWCPPIDCTVTTPQHPHLRMYICSLHTEFSYIDSVIHKQVK